MQAVIPFHSGYSSPFSKFVNTQEPPPARQLRSVEDAEADVPNMSGAGFPARLLRV